MSLTDLGIYNFIFNKMLPLKWLWSYQTHPFDMLVNINKCLHILYIFACYLLYCFVLFNGIPCNSVIFDLSTQVVYGTQWNIPWNSKRNPLLISQFHRIPWNSVVFDLALLEFHGIPLNPMSFEMAPFLFHGIPWISVILDLSSKEFHGTTREPDVN